MRVVIKTVPYYQSVEKRHVGHSKKFVATLQFERQIKKEANEKEDVDNQQGSKPKCQKSKGYYIN
jgi:hypothetical protein